MARFKSSIENRGVQEETHAESLKNTFSHTLNGVEGIEDLRGREVGITVVVGRVTSGGFSG